MKKSEIIEFYNKLDRKLFIDSPHKAYAAADRPLPIGFGQTISQPTLVLQMTLELDLDDNCKVLEIGTGSAYQSVFLAEFANSVYTVERIKELADKARERLSLLGYNNIFFKVGDGSEGWAEYAPYDRIIVTAGAGNFPSELIDQLKAGGKMIIPLGDDNYQELLCIEKDLDGNLHKKSLGLVTFVEFKGKYGWQN